MTTQISNCVINLTGLVYAASKKIWFVDQTNQVKFGAVLGEGYVIKGRPQEWMVVSENGVLYRVNEIYKKQLDATQAALDAANAKTDKKS